MLNLSSVSFPPFPHLSKFFGKRKSYIIFFLSFFLSFWLKYKNLFSVGISFATYSKSGSFVARTASKTEPICIVDVKQRETYIKFKSLINYINTHYMDDITLDYAASFVGFSKYHFSRLFKEYTDSTFYDYLSHRRIQSAKTLLDDENLSITDIAFQTGFNNLTTFCISFQKIVNCSPSAYRNMLKRKNSANT